MLNLVMLVPPTTSDSKKVHQQVEGFGFLMGAETVRWGQLGGKANQSSRGKTSTSEG